MACALENIANSTDVHRGRPDTFMEMKQRKQKCSKRQKQKPSGVTKL